LQTTIRRVPDALRIRARNTPDVVAHDDTSRTLTFAEWEREVDEVAGGLARAGVVPGDRVLLPISNRHAAGFAVAYMAVLRAGGICVPLSTRLKSGEVRDYAELVGARWAITDQPGQIAELALAGSWTVGAMPRDASALPDAASLDAAAPCDIIGTSGTTGRTKGVVNSHEDLVPGLGDGTATTRSRSLLHALPFTGFGGCHAVMMLPLRIGSTVYTQPAFEAEGFLELIQDRRPDSLQLVPAMLRLIVDHPRAGEYDASSVKWIFTGTAPLPHDTVERIAALWPGPRLINVYGMSEGGRGTQTRSRDSVHKPGSVGAPLEPGSVEIRDPDGRVLPDGKTGEIWSRTDRPRRYWNDPEATAATWQDGWLKTGDLGFIDADGDLIMSGRSKELIIRGGYNIAPIEIEDVLHAHPAVAEAAVAGIAHDVLGEEIAAAVAFRSGRNATEDELRDWCAARLADNKVPRVWAIMQALPRNQNAKVVKRDLGPALQRAAEQRAASRDGRPGAAARSGET
jgi:long-chain acyl-CoA synthetase